MTTQDHDALIQDQFTRQAAGFAASRRLHAREALGFLVDAAGPAPDERSLDVACGPGSVVCAFAGRLAEATGLDATAAMLDEARALARREGLANAIFRQGDVYALPFDDGAFDIVSCRFAVHHFADPARAVAEMARVCRPGGRVLVCDAAASDDPDQAATLNAMERMRDPSTATFLTLEALKALFAAAGLPAPSQREYAVATEAHDLVANSFPDDPAALTAFIEANAEKLGMDARREGDRIHLTYPAVILTAVKGQV